MRYFIYLHILQRICKQLNENALTGNPVGWIDCLSAKGSDWTGSGCFLGIEKYYAV